MDYLSPGLPKSWYVKRSLPSFTPSVAGITPLDNNVQGQLQLSFESKPESCLSTGSACNLNAATPDSPVSPTLSPISSIGSQAENSLNKLVLGLNVEPAVSLNDYLNSYEDSIFNKGAVAFLNLVENAIRMYQVTPSFDQLIIRCWTCM